jgi:hypothetical protein
MQGFLFVSSLVAPMVALGVLAGCGGKIIGVQGSGGSGGGGPDSGVTVEPDGAMCVTVDAASYDDTCVQDTDCVFITTGQLCTGSCGCGDTPINVSGLAGYQAATSSVLTGDCPCPDPGTPRCLTNRCTACGFGPNEPAGCEDAGTVEVDAMTTSGDAEACVEVTPMQFGAVCGSDSDCILVTTGVICSGACDCSPNTAINQASLPAYQAATASVLTGICNCPALDAVARCLPEGAHSEAACAVCGFGPNQNPDCPDGG